MLPLPLVDMCFRTRCSETCDHTPLPALTCKVVGSHMVIFPVHQGWPFTARSRPIQTRTIYNYDSSPASTSNHQGCIASSRLFISTLLPIASVLPVAHLKEPTFSGNNGGLNLEFPFFCYQQLWLPLFASSARISNSVGCNSPCGVKKQPDLPPKANFLNFFCAMLAYLFQMGQPLYAHWAIEFRRQGVETGGPPIGTKVAISWLQICCSTSLPFILTHDLPRRASAGDACGRRELRQTLRALHWVRPGTPLAAICQPWPRRRRSSLFGARAVRWLTISSCGHFEVYHILTQM